MARIFISHSSRDDALAAALIQWLDQNGFDHVFLDFDKHRGLAVGDNWEKRLYTELDRSHAMIVIVTRNWHRSKWTWAEFTQARALGKAILPVIEASGQGRLVSPDIQHIDLTSDRESGLNQLRQRLTAVAMQGQRGFSWNTDRPPFPGLLSFEEEDAAVYFGRDEEARRVIERLNARRSQGGARLLLLLGASGSGKSSLLRAGVLPRLKRWDSQHWIALPPFRPQRSPVSELITSFARALDGSRSADWVRHCLTSEPSADGLGELARELRLHSGLTEAHVLVSVDQAEELFTRDARRDRSVVHVAGRRADERVAVSCPDGITVRLHGALPICPIIEGTVRGSPCGRCRSRKSPRSSKVPLR